MKEEGKKRMRSDCFFSLFFRQRLNAVGIPFLFALGILARRFSFASVLLVALLSAGLVIIALRRGDGEKRSTAVCMAVGLSLAILAGFALSLRLADCAAYDGRKATFSGTIVSKTDDEVTVRLHQLDDRWCLEKCAFADLPGEYAVGDRITGSATFSDSDPSAKRDKGLFLTAKKANRIRTEGKSAILSRIDAVRTRASSGFGGGREGAFWRAILLGDRNGLSDADKASFRRVGASHLLAISGLHVSEAVGVIFVFLRLIPLPRRARVVLFFPFIFVLFLICGAGVSVFRACVMASYAAAASLFSRRACPETALVFAGVIFAAFNPLSLFSASFLLSFASTFSILTVSAPLADSVCVALFPMRKKGALRRLAATVFLLVFTGFLVSAASFAATFPLQLILFGQVQILAPLFSMVLVFLFTPVLVFGVWSAVGLSFFGSLPLLSASTGTVARLFCSVVSRMASIAPAPVSFSPAAAGIGAVVFLLAFCLLIHFRARRSSVWTLYLAQTVFGITAKLFGALGIG